jgi:hypothetical protein
MVSTLQNRKRREAIGAFTYIIWGIWKKRNIRVFRNRALLPDIVAHLIWEEISYRAFAHTEDSKNLAAAS